MLKRLGKITGGVLGLLAGGPIGAAFGLVIGHVYDKSWRNGNSSYPSWVNFADSAGDLSSNPRQANFTVGIIVLGAKMAKADGRVTRTEVEAFKRVFQITPEQENSVGKIFNRARTSASGFEPYAFQLAHSFGHNPAVLEEILTGLFIIAVSDSAGLSPAEMHFLKSVAVIFDFDSEDFSRIAARAGVRLPGDQRPHDETQEAYEILGVRADTPAKEIKLAYHALIREHHPDRLMAQGLPPEFIATANEKMKRINSAYDTVCKIKGIK